MANKWTGVWWEDGTMWLEGVKKRKPDERILDAIRQELGNGVQFARGMVWIPEQGQAKFYPQEAR